MLSSGDILNIYDEPSLKKLIESYFSKTDYAESIGKTFLALIDEIFINVGVDELKEYFNTFDKSLIDDNRWLNATTNVINNREYTLFSNVGAEYFKKILEDFVSYNKNILINKFVIKYAKEKEIRDSILTKILSSPQLTTNTISELLGGALREENRLRDEYKAAATIAFEVYSKEIISYELPQLQNGKIYTFKNEAGEGVGNIIENRLEFRPPTVLEETKLYAEVLTLSADGVVEARDGFNIKVKPPKYLKPAYKTYRLRPTTTLKVGLEPVEENYKYYASVPKGFGSVSIEDYMLSYTAPTTALAQNVGVRLALVWNEKTVVYDTVVNFSVVVDGSEVDTSDSGNAFTQLKEKVENTSTELENIKMNSDSSTIIIDGNIFENID